MIEKIPFKYIIIEVNNIREITTLENKLKDNISNEIIIGEIGSHIKSILKFPNYIFLEIRENFLNFLYARTNITKEQLITTYIDNTYFKSYNKIFTFNELDDVVYMIKKIYQKKPFYTPKQTKRTLENKIIKFDDFDIDNLEFRKGSLEYGELVSKLLEFLRIFKNENEDKLAFNIDDFEEKSNITLDEVKELNKLPYKKSLFDFDIIIEDDKIIFNGLQNKKSFHAESNTFNSIRNSYEILGVKDFYKKIENEYKNPHLPYIEKCMNEILLNYDISFNNVLDLASGNGEITEILMDNGYDNIIGCDPYLSKQYEENTDNKCLSFSFEDIQKGAIDHLEFDTIVCSYALHLCNKSILPELLWKLSLISNNLIILSPNNNPIIKDDYGWENLNNFKIDKCKVRIYKSKNE